MVAAPLRTSERMQVEAQAEVCLGKHPWNPANTTSAKQSKASPWETNTGMLWQDGPA